MERNLGSSLNRFQLWHHPTIKPLNTSFDHKKTIALLSLNNCAIVAQQLRYYQQTIALLSLNKCAFVEQQKRIHKNHKRVRS